MGIMEKKMETTIMGFIEVYNRGISTLLGQATPKGMHGKVW